MTECFDLELDATQVAPKMIGHFLCIRKDGREDRHVISEVEAYHGFEDKASHAHRGKTPRNAVMFGPHSYWYVYLCYGVHWMLNLVTGPVDYPSAVLIRGAGLFDGPGKLTKAMGIDRRFDGEACSRETGLWIERNPDVVREGPRIMRTQRIGVDYAGAVWAKKKWRFVMAKK